MKKRIFLLAIMVISFLFVSFNSVLGYSPHYLPGGKNYLSTDNFVLNNDYYETIDAFAVKPYTEYTITVPRGYTEGQSNFIEMELFENAIAQGSIAIDSFDMTYYSYELEEWYYYTFTTTSETNYLTISFDDTDEFFLNNGFGSIQLEEGDIFTGYETYVEGALIDTQAPYFQNAGTVVSYYDSPITVAEIQAALSAYDAVDGNVTANISLVQDNYTAFVDVLGTYDVVFSVTDSSNNSTEVTVDVELVDILKPVFSELDTIQAVYPNVYTVENIKAMLSASDNYDGDISDQISLVSDSYSASSSTVGSYEMVFSVTDSSGNSETYTQNIEVVDNESPIVSGITTITIGYDSVITQAEVEANLTCTDNYDDSGSLNLILISDTYSANITTLGIYDMTFTVTDSSGNITTQAVVITVVDEIGPMLYFDSSIIQTYTDTVMSLPDFTQLLINSNEIENQDYEVTVTYDSYTKNANQPGTYHLSLRLTNETGDEIDKELEIRVIDRPVDYIYEPVTHDDEDASFIDKYKNYLLGGIASVLLVVSNIVWVAVFKKKS